MTVFGVPVGLHSLFEIWGGLNLGYSATLIFALLLLSRRISRRKGLPDGAPPLCILRPCEGDEPGLYENLLSSLRVPYAGPRRVLFLLPDVGDPAYAVAHAVLATVEKEALLQQSVTASIVLTAPRALENRKVAQLIVGLTNSDEELVVCADSDVRLGDGDLQELLSALGRDTETPRVGAAFASPLEVAPLTAWDRASAAVVGGSPQSFLALYGLSALFGGEPNMAGALCLYRRSALHAIGGFDGVRDCLGEDNEIARRLVRAGYRVTLGRAPARCFDGGRDAAAAIARVARWMTVVRAQRPGMFCTYPLLVAATPVLLLSALAFRTPFLVALTSAVLVLRLLLGLGLRRFFGLRIGFFAALRDVFFGEGLLWLGFVRAAFSRRISWRGHPFFVERGGRLRPATRPS